MAKKIQLAKDQKKHDYKAKKAGRARDLRDIIDNVDSAGLSDLREYVKTLAEGQKELREGLDGSVI